MPNPNELIGILDRILNGSRDESEVAQLRQWLKVSGTTLQFVSQDGKLNTNIGQVQGGEIHIGDRHYQFDVEALRELLQPTTHAPNIDWHALSQAMLEEQLRLTTNPLTSGEGISYLTEQVYVPLGLVERKRQTRRREDVPPEQGSLLYEETEITQRFEHEQFLEQVLRQGQSPKSRGKRIAIIGEPGAGKTTLLQQITQWVGKQGEGAIAIWVSLADLRGQELEPYLLEQWLQAVARKLGQAEASLQVKDAFVAQFQQGRVWLLLDGVDEMQVLSGNPLAEISRQVRMGGLLSQARIVLSCRLNLWDGNRNALDTFDTYRTLEFSYPQQVEQFIGQWFGVLSEEQAGQAERLCTALKAPGKERIQDLVKNPLRLTLLCFNWYLGEGTLPETKAGLYEQFVADFYEWKREQFPTTGEQGRRLNAALGDLAREAIDKEATRFRLRHDFVCKFLGEPDEEGSLFKLALQLGWLNKVGVDAENPRKAVYGFFHPIFQEYFAAQVVDDWHYFLNHIPENPSHPDANYRIFEMQWKESILLWLSQNTVKNKDKEDFLENLMNFDDYCDYSSIYKIEQNEGFYERRAYFLALEGISEYQEFSQLDRIIKKIVLWSFGLVDKDSGQWLRYLKTFEDKSIAILLQVDKEKVAPALVNLIKNTPPNTIIQAKAVEILKKIDPSNPASHSSLVDLMNKSEEPLLNPEVIKKTIKIKVLFLNQSLKIELPIHPLLKLGGVFATTDLEKICLENLCKYSHNEGFRLLAAEYLLKIDLTSYIAKTTLENIIYHSHDNYICDYAERALSTLTEKAVFENISQEILLSSDSKVISIEEKILEIENTHDKGKRIFLLGSLLEIDPNNIQAINSLIQLVQNSQDELFRFKAAIELEKIALGNRYAITSLERLLHDVGLISSFRSIFSPANLLAKLNNGSSQMIYKVIIISLWKIDPENLNVITALENLIRYSYDLHFQMQTAKVLEKIDIGNSTAINVLYGVKRSFFDNEDLLDIINILLKFDLTKLKAIEILLKLVKTTQNISDAILGLRKLKSLLTTNEHMPKVVNYLKFCLLDLVCEINENEDLLNDVNFVSLLESYYEVIIFCAQTLTYPVFYQAWHTQEN